MNVMGNTITGAASGETTITWRRRIHNLRQKDRRVTNTYFCMLFYYLSRLEKIQSFFVIKNYRGVMMMKRRAVVSVVGKDQVGIIAKVTNILSDNQVNILDISQTILQDFFTMMMLVDVTGIENLDILQKQFDEISEHLGLKINIQLEEIFQSMHRI